MLCMKLKTKYCTFLTGSTSTGEKGVVENIEQSRFAADVEHSAVINNNHTSRNNNHASWNIFLHAWTARSKQRITRSSSESNELYDNMWNLNSVKVSYIFTNSITPYKAKHACWRYCLALTFAVYLQLYTVHENLSPIRNKSNSRWPSACRVAIIYVSHEMHACMEYRGEKKKEFTNWKEEASYIHT